MANLIPLEELIELKSASEVKDVAKDAVLTLQKQSVASAINNAANTGEYSTIWQHNSILPEVLEELESLGYMISEEDYGIYINWA